MNCPYNFVFYDKNTMTLSSLPHLYPPPRGRMVVGYLLSPSPLPSPVKREGERSSSRGRGRRQDDSRYASAITHYGIYVIRHVLCLTLFQNYLPMIISQNDNKGIETFLFKWYNAAVS